MTDDRLMEGGKAAMAAGGRGATRSARTVGLVLLAVAVLMPLGAQDGIEYESGRWARFHPLEEEPEPRNPLREDEPRLLEIKNPIFTDTVVIDFEKRQITFTRRHGVTGQPVWEYHYPELEEYLNSRQRFELYTGWDETLRPAGAAEEEADRRPSLEFRMPVHYPAWARRVLGDEPPMLSIHGYQEISISYRRGSKEVEGSDEEDLPVGLQFDQQNHFNIRGSVGRLVSIEIEAGNEEDESGFGEQMSDQLKNFKIEYKGEGDELEDEIIQEVVAGYTNFQMPGAGLAGYSESHEGLFGIKVRSQLGPLSLTTIASHEKSKTEKKELDLSGSSGGGGWTDISEKDYEKYRFYWLDSAFLLHHLDSTREVPTIEELQIYRLEEYTSSGTPDASEHLIMAKYGEEENPIRKFKLLRRDEDYYQDLKRGYVSFYDAAGIGRTTVIGIYLRMSIGDSTIEKGDLDLVEPVTEDSLRENLWVLKPREETKPTDSTFNLMWRNVYRLPRDAKAEDFEMTVQRVATDTSDFPDGSDEEFVTILGVADEDGDILRQRSDIFVFPDQEVYGNPPDYEGYLIIPRFASDTTFHRDWPFANPDLGKNEETNWGTDIYTKTDNEWSDLPRAFLIRMKGSSAGGQRAVHQLGFGVIPASEKLIMTPGNVQLIVNQDYRIDYMMGRLELISQRALSATKIDIEYQQESISMFDQRGFVGLHGKLDLPFIGRDSYLATTLMYQSASAGDEIPRLGQEPFSRFMFGTNGKVNFEPLWMTKAVNLLPLIKTDAASTAGLDFEVAGSIVKPASGDEAYLDDFEGSSDDLVLGEHHEDWHRAAPPYDDSTAAASGAASEDDLKYLRPPAWHWYWYQPAHYQGEATPWEAIWRRRDDQVARAEDEQYASTLRLIVEPFPADSALREGVMDPATGSPLVNPWAGIVKSIPLGLKDRQDDQYLEFWVNDYGAGGTLHIDVGEIAEDQSLDGREPNGLPDTERRDHNELRYDPARDLGLDSLRDPAEVYYYPRNTGNGWEWVELGYLDPKLGEFAGDPARDNWVEYVYNDKEKPTAFERKLVSGTQGDGELESEALGVDGFNLHRDNFYRISLDLATLAESPYYDQPGIAAGTRWRRIRIPIHPDHWARIGEPEWSDVRAVRVWWSDFADTIAAAPDTLEFTGMRFIGNEWESVDTTDTAKIEAGTVNSEDNRDIYATPEEIYQQLKKRAEANTEPREQGLSLEYRNVHGGEVALVERHFGQWQDINLSAYDDLRMYVRAFRTKDILKTTERDSTYPHPDDPAEDTTVTIIDTNGTEAAYAPIDNSTWFVVRFGANDSTYYEYRRKRLSAIDTVRMDSRGAWDHLSIDLRALSGLKRRYFEQHGDTVSSIDARQDDGNEVYRVYSRTGMQPTFSNVKWMALGVMRDSTAAPDSGVIMIEGIRVSGLQSRMGMAATLNFHTQWADFMTLEANLNYRNADFRSMSEDFLPERPTTLSGGIGASWTLDKFLPAAWGVAIPFGVNVSSDLMRPKIKSGSDIYLTGEDDEPDGLREMGKDFAGMVLGTELESDTTESEHYETRKTTRSWNVGYGKSNPSKNPITNLTADRIDVGYTYSMDTTAVKEGAREGDDDHVEITATRRRSGTVKYDLSPHDPPEWTAWEPFKKSTSTWLPNQMKRYKLSLLPSVVQFDLLDATYTTLYDTSTIDQRGKFEEELGLKHGFQFKYTPWAPVLSFDYNVGFNRDLKSALRDWRNEKRGDRFVHAGEVPLWDGFLQDAVFEMDTAWRDYTVTYGERSRSQRAGVDLTPQFVEWLTHTVDYDASSEQSLVRRGTDTTSYMNVGVNTTFAFKSDFRIRTLFTELADATKNREQVKGVFDAMDKALGKIELSGFNFTYDAQSGLKNNYFDPGYLREEDVGSLDFLRYKLGLYERSPRHIVTGTYNDRKFGGMQSRTGDTTGVDDNDTRTGSQNISVSTRIRIPDPLDLSVNTIRLGWKRDYVKVPEEPHFRDSTVAFPDWAVGVSSRVLEKLPFVRMSMDNLDLSSSYNYVQSMTWTAGSATQTDSTRSISHRFTPLVALSGRLKKVPINLSYRCNWDKTGNKAWGRGTDSDEKNVTNSFDADYTVRPSATPKKINLFNRWEIPIKGEFNAGLEAEHTSSETTVAKEEPIERWSFRIHPHMSYDFTDNVRGTTEYLYTIEYSGETRQKTDQNIFTLTVRINF